jgi:hypothetical protein
MRAREESVINSNRLSLSIDPLCGVQRRPAPDWRLGGLWMTSGRLPVKLFGDQGAADAGPGGANGGSLVTVSLWGQLVLGACSGLAMAYAAFILIAPDVGPPPLFPFQDKVFHAVAFAGLTGPAVLVLPRRLLWFWLAHMVMLGGGIEVVQALGHEGRQASVWDFLADLVGIAAATGAGRAIRGLFVKPL